LVERVLCKHEVVGSIPSDSTIFPLIGRFASDRERYKFPPWRIAGDGKSDIVN
jgi:hypothetical protein